MKTNQPFILRLGYAVVMLGLLSSCAHLINHTKDKEKSRIYLQKSADNFNSKNYNDALDAAFDALKLDPNFAAAYNQVALIYMETKRYDKSEEAFQRALGLQPDFPEVENNLGVLYNREEKFQEAVKSLEGALRNEKYLTPENAYTNLGYSYFRLGNLARAKAYHQKALDISPQFCLANKNLGDVYAKEKNYPKAAENYQKAATNCPLYQESQYKLGLVLMKMGQRNVAKAELQKLVERHKTGPYVDRSNEVLKYLH